MKMIARHRHDDGPAALGPGEREWVESLAAAYRPAPMTERERTSFERRVLRATDQRSSSRSRTTGALMLCASAAAAIWLALPSSRLDTSEISVQPTEVSRIQNWEYNVLNPRELEPDTNSDHSEMLPAEYAAIESAFLL